MFVADITRKKLSLISEIITELQSSDFPHTDASDVLVEIKSNLIKRNASLSKLKDHTDRNVVNTTCKECMYYLSIIYPILGFILRSTNVRNAFELHGPLLRIVKMGFSTNEAKLLISSEWEFSPFTDTYPAAIGFENIVFIGMPASESGNSLCIPLTGHEFGHNIWSKYNVDSDFNSVLEDNIVDYINTNVWDEFQEYFNDVGDPSSLKDMLGRQSWSPAWQASINQCEELFCDFIGLGLFRESYLHAFSYFVAPGSLGNRSPNYPNMHARVEALIKASESYGIDVPVNYLERFEDSDPPSSEVDRFLLSISDNAVNKLIDDVAKKARRILIETYLDILNNETEISMVRYCLSIGVPIMERASLPSIINAAWIFYNEEMKEWEERFPSIYSNEEKKHQMLNDLVFKSIEVLEIEDMQAMDVS